MENQTEGKKKNNLILNPVEMAYKCKLDIDLFLDDYFENHDIVDRWQKGFIRSAVLKHGFAFFQYELLDYFKTEKWKFKVIDKNHVELLKKIKIIKKPHLIFLPLATFLLDADNNILKS